MSQYFLQPDLIKGFITEPISVTPNNPAIGYVNIYFKTDNKLYYIDSSGGEYELSGGGGGGSTLTVQKDSATVTTSTTLINFTGSNIAVTTSAAGQVNVSVNETEQRPSGGTLGQVLTKNSATDYDYSWQNINPIPTGGNEGQVLTKLSASDYDVYWADSTSNRVSLISTSLINAKTASNTTLYTVPIGEKYLISECIIEVNEFISVSGVLECGFGINAVNDSLFNTSQLIGLNTHFNSWKFSSSMGGVNIVQAGDDIDLNISAALTGTTATVNVYIIAVQLSP